MSSQKKIVIKSNPKTAAKLSDTEVGKLLGLKDREKLKSILINKFLGFYNVVQPADQEYVEKQVSDFIKSDSLTKVSLKQLENKIKTNAGTANAKKPVKSSDAPQSLGNLQQAHQHVHDDAVSETSSQRPKSVYVQGDSDNEWATMLKYDTLLYKKQLQLEKAKEKEQKRRIKEELDKQLADKARRKKEEEEEMKRYHKFVQDQVKVEVKQEKRKEVDMKSKIMQEKASRDQQLKEENQRKVNEKKTQRELDELLMAKIRSQLDEEAKRAQAKREEEKKAMKKLLVENEQYKKKMIQAAKKEKEDDVKAQQEYTKLVERQMAEREAEVKAREDRAKKFMSLMADTVVQNQRAQIIEEERRLLKNHLDREARESEEDKRRAKKQFDHQQDVKSYLDFQVAEKKRKRQEELELEKKQAEFWKKDNKNYLQHEKEKTQFIKSVNKEHADYLKKQIQKDNQKFKPISSEELLLNKPVLKEIAKNLEDAHFQKQLIRPTH